MRRCEMSTSTPTQNRETHSGVYFNFRFLNNRLVDKTSHHNSSKYSPNLSVFNLFLNASSISFCVVHIYSYFSTLSNGKDINYMIPTVNVGLHYVTRLCACTILLYQFAYQRLIKLLFLPMYYFFKQLIIVIGVDENRT
jgi:hypothetical protein